MTPFCQLTVPWLVKAPYTLMPPPSTLSNPLVAMVTGQLRVPPAQFRLVRTVKLPLPSRVEEFRRLIEPTLALLVRVTVTPLVMLAVSCDWGTRAGLQLPGVNQSVEMPPVHVKLVLPGGKA